MALAALAAAFCVLVSATAASADERTVVGHSVKGPADRRDLLRRHRAGAPASPGRRLHPWRRDRRDAGRPQADRRRHAAAGRPLGGPTLNPDGVAAGTRGNAHGVDLNRNFPFGWRPLGGGEYSGPRSLSEPESRAGYRLIRRIRPDLTIWFHQPFGLVDRSGGDAAVERRYAELVGLPLVGLRRYPGSASRWQNHTMAGSTAFVVELPAIAPGGLIRRAANSALTLAAEYASPEVSGATVAESWLASP